MNRVLMLALVAAFCFASVANATVVWSFGGAPGQVAQGTAYSVAGGGTITVYAEQVNYTTGVIQSTAATNGGVSTLSGLFQVNTSVNNNGTGIAPYNPSEGSAGSMGSQDGIEDQVVHNVPVGGQYSNILELQLGSNIAAGTTLAFLMQGPTIDPLSGGNTAVSVYYFDASSAQNLGGMSVFNNSVASPLGAGAISTTGTIPQFSITKDTAGSEFIAIQADCHYLLLDTATVTGTGGAVPEPRFYGILLIGMLGLAGLVRRKTRVTE